MDRAAIKLDNAVFEGRLRIPTNPTGYIRRPTPRPVRRVEDVFEPKTKAHREPKEPATQNYQTNNPYEPVVKLQRPHQNLSLSSAAPRPQAVDNTGSVQLAIQSLKNNSEPIQPPARTKRLPQLALPRSRRLPLPYILAIVVFAAGLFVAFNGLKTNNVAQAQINKLASQAQSSGSSSSPTPPSTVKPTPAQVSGYSVAPDMPRYIDIPFVGVHARVLQTGVRQDGSLGTPSNVFDTAWYSSSSKPGQPGAMVIDGHISSWTTKGVFYNLGQVAPTNLITITRGDGKTFNYKVVKVVTVKASSVDMTSLLVSQDTSKPGLNLISCSGDVIPGTNEFDKRIIVYSVLE